ncbi:MAG: toxic anion resistance protein [Chitinispirillaceae bacterium]
MPEETQLVLTKQNKDGILEIPDNPDDEINGLVARIQEQLKGSEEVKKMSAEIDLRDQQSLIEFGHKPAEEISTFADKILHSVKKSDVEDSSEMMKNLAKLMNTFDPKDFEKESGGILGKLFANAKKAIEKILAKYQTIGGEIDKIYTEINGYKSEIVKTNQNLEELYNRNFVFYEQLEKYIVAGKLVLEHIKENELPKLQEKAASGNQMDNIRLENMNTCVELLEQRVYDLEMAKVVSLQTAPQIRMIQKGNYKLVAKIQSAFIVTIPLFKIALMQAIALKRQKLIKESMEALDEATNKLIAQNAQMAAKQSTEIAKMSSGSVKVETLIESWNTIKQGIDDTRAIEEENKKLREEKTKQLHSIQEDITRKMSNQNSNA